MSQRSLNSISISGNLGGDAKTKDFGDYTVCEFSVAVADNVKRGGEWKDETDWINVKHWVKAGSGLIPLLTKGQKVIVTGRMKAEQYEKNGDKRTAYFIKSADVVLIGSKGEGSAKRDDGPPQGQGDDIPF